LKQNYVETNNQVENLYLPYSIRELRAGANKFSNFPDISNLYELRHLDLCYNTIEDVPPELGNLSKLEDLYLCENNIQILPYNLINLNLKSTLFYGNPGLPEGIDDVESFKTYLNLFKEK